MEWKWIITVAVGGSFGAVSRFLLSNLLNPIWSYLPLGTLVVNLIGCFFMGVLINLSLAFTSLPRILMVGLFSGFLGSFTTFSAFSGEVIELITQKAYSNAFFQILLNVLGSLLSTFLGLIISKKVLLF